VAAYIGYTAVISPVFTLTALTLWVLVYALSKTPFIASLAAIVCLSAGIAHFTGLHAVPMAGILVITGFLVFNHRQNISDYFGADGKRSE
jgi:glycerol-3-phosphate acyltransferase PlsY